MTIRTLGCAEHFWRNGAMPISRQADYVAARQAAADKKTEDLKHEAHLPKKRWAYALRDTTTKESRKVG